MKEYDRYDVEHVAFKLLLLIGKNNEHDKNYMMEKFKGDFKKQYLTSTRLLMDSDYKNKEDFHKLYIAKINISRSKNPEKDAEYMRQIIINRLK